MSSTSLQIPVFCTYNTFVQSHDTRSFDESKTTNPKLEEHGTRDANTINVSELDELGEPARIKYRAAIGGGAVAKVQDKEDEGGGFDLGLGLGAR
ncbi:hypothetical protein ACFX2J_019661 [Malus domestica]